LENALDWVARSGELHEKPIALVNPSPRSTYAQASLVEVLRTVGAKFIDEAAVTLHPSGPLTLEEILAAPSLSQTLRASLDALLRVVGSQDGNHR
jgi:NAD(P)H-dependent FMN reductase